MITLCCAGRLSGSGSSQANAHGTRCVYTSPCRDVHVAMVSTAPNIALNLELFAHSLCAECQVVLMAFLKHSPYNSVSFLTALTLTEHLCLHSQPILSRPNHLSRRLIRLPILSSIPNISNATLKSPTITLHPIQVLRHIFLHLLPISSR